MQKSKRSVIHKSLLCFSFIVIIILYINLIWRFIKAGDIFCSNFFDIIKYDYYREGIPFYILNYFSYLLFFCTCLLYIKRKKVIYYICEGISLVLLTFCIRYDLPLFPRNYPKYQRIWQIDAIEYLYPVFYIGMFLFMVLFPVIYGLIKQYYYGKKMLVFLTVFMLIGIDFITVISMLCRMIELQSYGGMYFYIYNLFLKGILLFLLYKIMIRKEELQAEPPESNSSIRIKRIGLGVIVLIIVLFSVFAAKSGIIISRRAEIDGYWFVGNVQTFIDKYKNPYQEKRNYLSFEFIEEVKTDESQEGYILYYDEQQECYMVTTYGRKLEGIYYLSEFSEKEGESSSLHRRELTMRLASIMIEDKKTYRAVLSAETYKDAIFYYQITSDVKYTQILSYPNDSPFSYIHERANLPREIETYDVLLEGKEIPAYFLGMVDYFGIVKVEPYLHFGGEIPLNPYIVHYQLQTVRQY